MSREPRILRGVFFIVLATALFVAMNTVVKLLRPHLPTVELIWARTLGHTLFIFAIFGPGHGWWRLLETRKPGTQLARSLLLLASTSFFTGAADACRVVERPLPRCALRHPPATRNAIVRE